MLERGEEERGERREERGVVCLTAMMVSMHMADPDQLQPTYHIFGLRHNAVVVHLNSPRPRRAGHRSRLHSSSCRTTTSLLCCSSCTSTGCPPPPPPSSFAHTISSPSAPRYPHPHHRHTLSCFNRGEGANAFTIASSTSSLIGSGCCGAGRCGCSPRP